MGNNMNILNFKKRIPVDVRQELINEFISVRTKLKQLELQKDKLIKEMNEIEKGGFIYNDDNLPIAKLTVSKLTGFDIKLFKEEQLEVYAKYPNPSERRTWYIL